MANNKRHINFFKKVITLIDLIISTSGYVIKHATKIRTIVILLTLAFNIYLTIYQPHNFKIAISYFLISLFIYIGFITLVLRKNGYRKWFIKKWGDKKGYLIYEGILGFIFFNTASSMVYIASSTSGNLFNFINPTILFLIVAILFVTGFVVKLWAAKIVSMDIYYWKDMFLGRKICKFVVTGPYKYLKNPMYGVGQLQAYAIAIFYGSIYGLIAAMLYQSLVFTFYYKIEMEFIKRIYQKK